MKIIRKIRYKIYCIRKSLNPLCIGDYVFYLANSYHNGRNNAHYRVYCSKVTKVLGDKIRIQNGFWLYDFEVYRTEKKANKKARRLNAKKKR